MASPRVWLAAWVGVALIAGCSTERDAGAPDAAPSPALAEPTVVMAADPAPPFTYWAPEGAVIRNHPREPDIWIAEGPNDARRFYFGDACRASERQDWIGQDLEAIPPAAPAEDRRVVCTACARTSDLDRQRTTIDYDAETRRVTAVSCG